MEETSAQAGDQDADHGPRVVRREGQGNVSQSVDGQSGCQELLAAQPVRQHAHAVTRQKVGEHHQREQERGLFDAREFQVTLHQQIKRHECDVINVRERVQRAAEPKRADLVSLACVHCHPELKYSSKNNRAVRPIPRGRSVQIHRLDGRPNLPSESP